VSWASNDVYLYDVSTAELPATLASTDPLNRFVVMSGTGFTPGVYTATSVSAAYPTGVGSDGNRNLWNFNPGRPGVAGSRGGIGYFLRSYGTHRIVCVGNSLTLGTGATNNIGDYPTQMHLSFIADSKHYDTVNLGIGGAVGADLLNSTNFPASVTYYQPETYTETCYVLWEITNDLKSGFSPRVAMDNMEKMTAKKLSSDEFEKLAIESAKIRMGEKFTDKIVPLFEAKRYADNSPDLFTAFNVIQENVMRTGFYALNKENNVATKIRAIKGVNASIELNTALYNEAMKLVA
jgi:hypothetical protein